MSNTNNKTPRSIIRADAVGSLMRPDSVAQAIEQLYAKRTCGWRPPIYNDQLLEWQEVNRQIDHEVQKVIQRQIDCGLDVVTDGEMRRTSFLSSFQDSLESLQEPTERMIDRDEDGNITYETFGEPIVTQRLKKAYSPLTEEAAFIRSVTDHPFKLTLPTPSYFLTDFVAIKDGVYQQDREDFLAEVIEIQKLIVTEAIAAGARNIQFDFPIYPGLVDENYTRLIEAQLGMPADKILQTALAADAAVMQDIPEGVTVGLHLCRGNIDGGFWNGSLLPIAEQMFAELPHDRFLFEWENQERDGDYEPIKFIGKGQIMAMGLVSSKDTVLESDDEILKRIDQASQFLPLEQLALTTQCGFASFCGDHLIKGEDAQWNKLELISRIADRVWGTS